jgi:transcriptional regulator
MYIPKHFEINEQSAFAFIESHAFGQLISSVNGKPFSTHMPFLISDDKKQLIGHIAKQNPQHLKIEGQEVLVTFLGSHEYISPSWYASQGVPTWNYQAVHVYGSCKIIHEEEIVKSCVDSLTKKYEANFSEPWQAHYNTSLLDYIVGLEITIHEVQGKFKLGQNRSVQDQQQVLEKLQELGSFKMAEAMKVNFQN